MSKETVVSMTLADLDERLDRAREEGRAEGLELARKTLEKRQRWGEANIVLALLPPSPAQQQGAGECPNCEGGSGYTRYWNGFDEVVEDCTDHRPPARPPAPAGVDWGGRCSCGCLARDHYADDGHWTCMVHPELGDHEPPRRRADLPPPTAKPFSPGPLVSALRGFIAAGLPPPNPHYLPGGRPPPLADCQCCLDNEAPCDADCTCIEGCPNR